MTEPSRAVFLSYASQDAEAAQRICEALRAGGMEVWFDRSELRGGDAWDRSIRQQIRECALFVPVISAHTDARREGYFRLEWKLAVDRTHTMSDRAPFLVPAVIDDTSDSRADVPDRFREVQWTWLPGGETSPAFVDRVRGLLSPESSTAPAPVRSAASSLGGGTLPVAGRAHSRRGLLYGATSIVVLLALGYLGFERLNRSKIIGPGVASIAVLPLTNESGEASQQYFSDGISEDLITALSQFQELKVIGRTSSFQFRDSKEDSRSIGAKLGVAHLLEGSVRKSGDMIRVSAELIDTADASTQWSERYDRPYKDLFALQDEITHAVAEALKAKLLLVEHAAEQSDRPPGGNVVAYNAWLQGNFYNHLYSETGFRKAIEYYTQAIQIDPRYARAWSSLAIAESNLGRASEGASAQEAFAKAREAAERAIAIAPGSAAAHRAWGSRLLDDFDWHGAEAEFRRALALAPNDGDTKVTVGIVLQVFGELGQALELTQQALATDPLRADWLRHLASILFALNRLDEAERTNRRVLELQPGTEADRALLAMIETQRGNAQAALAAAHDVPPGTVQDFALALARQIGKDRSAADAALNRLIEKYAVVGAFGIADVYALRNDANSTFAWLDRAWSNRDQDVAYLLSDPFILRYKDDPRFAAFCRKVGLPTPGEAAAASPRN